jgi:hypothetical protein
LILNTTAIIAELPYPVTTYLSTDNVCNDVSDADGCLLFSTTGSFDNVSVNTPLSFTGTPGFANYSLFGNMSQYFPMNVTADLSVGDPLAPFGSDPSFFCYAGLGQNILYQPFVSQSFAQDSIGKMCSEIAGLTLDPVNLTAVPVPFAPDPETDTVLWLQASWQVGDPACNETSRMPSTQECNSELGYILNSCDTGSITNKYGGTHLNNCIDWELWINATLPVSQQMTCMLEYVYLCLESESLLIEK